MHEILNHENALIDILETLNVGVITDVSGRVVFVSDRYSKILDVIPSEAVGKMVWEIIPNTRMHLVAQTGEEEIGTVFKLLNGESIIVNRIPIRKEGKIIGVIASGPLSRADDLHTDSTVELIDRLNQEIKQYKHELKKLRGAKYSLEQIVGSHPGIVKIKELVTRAAQTKSTVLITGDTGTGKELIAHAIHQQSPRSHNPFITINCAAIPKDLLESELFGYEEGAFTGAKKGGKLGKFELANHGTLMLDEINELPLHLQSKLLRVIQEKEIEKVGGVKPVEVDVRLVCTSNQDLLGLVEKGYFREDLFYRIDVVVIHLPPLRERLDDLPLLVDHCLAKINKVQGLNIKGCDREVLDLFAAYHWPGNVRELEHVLERAANAVQSGYLGMEHFQHLALKVSQNKNQHAVEGGQISLKEARDIAEKQLIINTLVKTRGNKKLAAIILEIDRSVLYDKIKKYGITL